jgi:hypothetical protein
LIFLSLAAFKHKHYCIPILPPLSIFCAKLLSEHARSVGRRARYLYASVFGVMLIGFLIVGGLVMPRRDTRRTSADFLRSETAKMPADATLYIAGDARPSAHPYIERECVYRGSWSEVVESLDNAAGDHIWVLALRDMLLGAERELDFEEIANEAASERYPEKKTLVLGRVYRDKGP